MIQKHIKSVLYLWLALALTGCNEDKEQQLARCQVEAQIAHGGATIYDYDPMVVDKVSNTIFLCMQGYGYKFDLRLPVCAHKANSAQEVVRPECYRPTDYFGGLWYDFSGWRQSKYD